MIRALTIATVGLAALWAGWWFVAAHAAGRAVEGLVAGLRADGWEVGWNDIGTAGFPSRIDTTARDLVLSDPSGAVTWEMPRLQAFALSYRPNEIILAWPPVQEIALPGQRLTLAADALMASARVGIATDLPLETITVQSGLVTLASDAGWRIGASRLLAALRRTPAAAGGEAPPGSYDLFAELRELTLPALPGAPAGPGAAGELRLDAGLVLDQPLARGAAPQLEAISLRSLRADWGSASLALSGEVTADAQGFAQGTAELELRNWPLLLEMAQQAGVVGAEEAARLHGMLDFAAHGDATLTAPLGLAGGMVLLGGLVPLGPAPRLRN